MFGALLKELRTQKGVKQTDIAEAIGVSNGNVGDWERGRSKPGYDSLIALSRYFGVTADYLLEITQQPNETRIDLSNIKQEQGLLNDGSPLTDEEADMIAMYRLLPSGAREETFDYVYFKYERFVERKRESIYSTYAVDESRRKSGSDDDDTRRGTA